MLSWAAAVAVIGSETGAPTRGRGDSTRVGDAIRIGGDWGKGVPEPRPFRSGLSCPDLLRSGKVTHQVVTRLGAAAQGRGSRSHAAGLLPEAPHPNPTWDRSPPAPGQPVRPNSGSRRSATFQAAEPRDSALPTPGPGAGGPSAAALGAPGPQPSPQDPSPSACNPQHPAPAAQSATLETVCAPLSPQRPDRVSGAGVPSPGSPRVAAAAAFGPRPPRAPRRPRLCLRRLRSHRGQSPRRPASAQRPLPASE